MSTSRYNVTKFSENDQSPGIYLCEGALQSYCELRAPSAEKAAFYLDTALATRATEQSHLFYTLHVYQYSVAGKGGGQCGHRHFVYQNRFLNGRKILFFYLY